MYCPFCRHSDSRVIDSRVSDDGGAVRRRRQCPQCERKFTTVEQTRFVVVKRSGVIEPFSREKIVSGVRKACKGRPVTEDQLARLGQSVEEELRASGVPEIPTEDIGVAILGPLAELDPVAYLRFASVYRHFDSLDDFRDEIERLASAPTPQ
ncbi:MAG: transcriptional regulator NrdR [Propionibacteriaceae bacterium]|nr:transcriptional regulator NrdR [Propionibacteriaceae bacterium]